MTRYFFISRARKSCFVCFNNFVQWPLGIVKSEEERRPPDGESENSRREDDLRLFVKLLRDCPVSPSGPLYFTTGWPFSFANLFRCELKKLQRGHSKRVRIPEAFTAARSSLRVIESVSFEPHEWG